MERDFIVSGVHIGEHSFEPDRILEEIRVRCVEKGMKFCMIRPQKGVKTLDEHYLTWAQYLADNNIYFAFLYAAQYPPKGQESHLELPLVSKLKEIAGEYFMGEIVGECGSLYAGKLKGYYTGTHNPFHPPLPTQNMKNLTDAKDKFVNTVRGFVAKDKLNSIDNIMSVEPTFLNKYNMDAGVTIPLVETMWGNPEILFSMVRGCVRAKSLEKWGTYIAHEWYGGFRHDDTLKQKRLGLLYKYAYMSGSNIFCAESGDELVSSYGERYEKDSEICLGYDRESKYLTELIEKDDRIKGGPKAKVAFVYGNLDGWTGSVLGSSLWGQHEGEEWGNSSPEHSWKILDEIGSKRSWRDIENYGSQDLSAFPAWGMYDIIPAESSAEKFSRYDYLIFVGWNTMTEEIYDNLKTYVTGGGTLFMCAAHLNISDVRGGDIRFVHDGNVKDLFGCTLGEIFRSNNGYKFEKTSLADGMMYPGTSTHICDPIFSNGYASYADITLYNGEAAARLDDSFRPRNEEEFASKQVAVVENKLGKGTAILMANTDYPGQDSVYPAYRSIVREIISLSHRKCDVKVYGSDKVRFSVYDNNKIYLLNTDFDTDACVVVERNLSKDKICLKPCELRILE